MARRNLLVIFSLKTVVFAIVPRRRWRTSVSARFEVVNEESWKVFGMVAAHVGGTPLAS